MKKSESEKFSSKPTSKTVRGSGALGGEGTQQPSDVDNQRVDAQLRTNSARSEESKSSDAQVDSSKSRKIFVTHRVDYTSQSISFEINPDNRPDTNLDSQGDHTTSYVSILQVLLASTNTSGIRSAIQKITEISNNILEPEYKNNIPEAPGVMTHDERVKASDIIKSNTEGADLADKVSNGLKYAKKSALAQHLAELSSHFLTSIQKQELTTFYSQGRVNRKESEGSKAKSAIRALYVLDELASFEKIPEEEWDEYFENLSNSLGQNTKGSGETEDDHIMRYGLNVWFNDDGKKADELKAILRDSKNEVKPSKINKLRDELALQSERIAEFIGDLFDYHRVLIFNLKEAFQLTESEKERVKNEPALKERLISQKIRNYFDLEIHTCEFYNGENGPEVKITRDNLEDLPSIIAKHVKIIELAFPNMCTSLRKVGQPGHPNNFDNSIDNFLSKVVLEEQEWGEHEGINSERLNIDVLKDEIKKIQNPAKRVVDRSI